MNAFFTTDKQWIEKWDDFLKHESRGTHLQNSNWLNTYKSYGFSVELFIMVDNDKQILGGFMAVIAKKAFFKFYIIPQGPIVKVSQDFNLETCFQQIYLRSKKLKCCYVQFSIPISNNLLIYKYVYSDVVREYIPKSFSSGKKFKYIYAGYGMNWIDLTEFKEFEAYLSNLKLQVRRNIKLAYNRNESVEYLSKNSTKEELKAIYNLVTLNAQQFNYVTRDFNELGSDLSSLLEKGLGVFQRITNNSEIVSSGFSYRNKDHLVYLFGGTIRMKPDTKAGYLIHASNIKTSIEKGLPGYNISMGGSDGVKDFKVKFGSQEIMFDEPHYYCIHNNLLFAIFQGLDKHLKKYKGLISKYLK